MTKADLLALAARCEAATGADRELDCRIDAAAGKLKGEFLVVGPPTYELERYFSRQEGVDSIGYDLLKNAKRYTASLDAAMTLVKFGGGNGFCLRILTADNGTDHLAEVWRGDLEVGTRAATPALALTAACLRAIAEEMPDV